MLWGRGVISCIAIGLMVGASYGIETGNIVGYATVEIKPGTQTIESAFADLGGRCRICDVFSSALAGDRLSFKNDEHIDCCYACDYGEDGRLHWYNVATGDISDQDLLPTKRKLVYHREQNETSTVAMTGEVRSLSDPVMQSRSISAQSVSDLAMSKQIPTNRSFVVHMRNGHRSRVFIDDSHRIVREISRVPLNVPVVAIKSVEPVTETWATVSPMASEDVKKVRFELIRRVRKVLWENFKSVVESVIGRPFRWTDLWVGFIFVPAVTLVSWLYLWPWLRLLKWCKEKLSRRMKREPEREKYHCRHERTAKLRNLQRVKRELI